MFVQLPEVEAHVEALVDQGSPNDALANMVVAVHNSYRDPAYAHKALFYPELDRLMQRVAQSLPELAPAARPASARQGSLVIATELYQVGGHSRVVEDLMRELESPTLVLTDLFANYRKAPAHLSWILDAFPNAPVIVLSRSTLWGKCHELQQLTQRLAPRSILYLQHHQDPLAFVGTLRDEGSRKTLIHHADHNPSLGNTLAGVDHVDVTQELAATCTKALLAEVSVLPVTVPDSGRKRFTPIVDAEFSVVTSGTHIKYVRHGELALQAIARSVLNAVTGRFVHIGPIDADWVAEVHAHLQQNGIDPTRFVPLGPVTSLWNTLAQLDTHVYLGSAPVGGLRAAIEAQGCGYPVLFHRTADVGSLLAIESIFASGELGWSTLPELAELLERIAPRHAALSDAARNVYEQRYSRQEFIRVLHRFADCHGAAKPASGEGTPAQFQTTRIAVAAGSASEDQQPSR